MPDLIATEAEMRELGATLSRELRPGDLVLLEGPLGAGKTTLVRGLMAALGWDREVRSPTFNLIQIYPTVPPVMHADLYRVSSWEGIGMEDYFDSHVCLIEWPDRAKGLVNPESSWRIRIEFEGDGRRVEVLRPC